MHAQHLTRYALIVLLAGLLAACGLGPYRAANTNAVQLLRPGDAWGGMTLTTGSDTAVSLWTACRPATSLNGITQTDCKVPAVPLAIGPSAAALAEVVNLAEWARLEWSLTLDGQPVDLEAFGTFDLLQPHKAPHGRDALVIYRAWDVLLAEPTPGPHTLLVAVTQQLHSGKEIGMTVETTEWIINFTIVATSSGQPSDRLTSVEPRRSPTWGENL